MTKKLKTFYCFILSLMVLIPGSLLAQENPLPFEVSQPGDRLKNTASQADYSVLSGTTLQNIIIDVVLYLLGSVGAIFLIMTIIAGVQWINAGGNEEIITKAKTRLKNAIIGFVLVTLAFIIITTLLDLFRAPLQ
jgi:hypothetical protein